MKVRLRPEIGKDIRSFPIGSYVVFYVVRKNHVEIVRILHGARDITHQFH